MPYIANPLEGLPIRNSFVTDQANLGTTPATDDTLIIYDISSTALKQLTIANLQASILASPTFTGVPAGPTANAGTDTTQLATTAFVTAATTALNTITEMTDVTITSNTTGEVLRWTGSAWVNSTLTQANILAEADPTFTGTLTVGSAVLSEADLEQIDDLTAGTAVASKALVVSSNKDIGTLRNLTIDGTFSDGNYTFDTSGNVSGLGTIGSGNITSSGTVQGTTITATTAFVPDASDGAALGTAALEFSDLFLADEAVISFGDDDDVTLTHVNDTGLLLSSTDKLQFGDAGTFIHQSSDGVLTIESDTTVDINGAVVFNGALSGITTLTASGVVSAGGITLGNAVLVEAELEMLDGITAGTAAASKAVVLDSNKDIGTIRNLTIDGVFTDGNYTFATDGSVTGLGAITSTGVVTATGFTIGSAVIAESELEMIDGITAGTAAANKAVVLDGSKNIATIGTISAGTTTIGSLVVAAASITDTSGAITFGNENLTTTGTLAAGTTTIGSLVVAAASITDTSGAITFGNENLSTTGTLAAGTTTIGSLVVAAASITDTSGSISFGDDNITTSGTVSAGNLTVTGTTTTVNSSVMTVVDPIIHLQTASGGGALSSDTNKDVGLAMQYYSGSAKTAFLGFDDSAVKLTFIADATLSSEVVSGSVGTIVANLEGNVTAGTLTVAAASITDSSGAISFGNENLTTTGTLSAGVITGTGFTIGSAVIIESELEMIDGITAGTAAASKALVLDASTNITGIGTISAGAITSSGVITGTAFTAGSAVLTEAELEVLDAVTVGTAIASKVVTTDASIDTTGQRNLTITGELDAATLDISGVADIAGALDLHATLDMNTNDIDNIRSATFIAEVDNGNSSTSDTIDWGAGQKQKSTLTGNCTYTFTAPDGPCNLMFKLIQDGTGSRTVTWPNTVKWPAATAATLTTTASATDIVAFYYDGTNYYAQSTLAFG